VGKHFENCFDFDGEEGKGERNVFPAVMNDDQRIFLLFKLLFWPQKHIKFSGWGKGEEGRGHRHRRRRR
jgi:hypothetical protein